MTARSMASLEGSSADSEKSKTSSQGSSEQSMPSSTNSKPSSQRSSAQSSFEKSKPSSSSSSEGSTTQSKPERKDESQFYALLRLWKRDFDRELYKYKLFCYEVNKMLENEKDQGSLPNEIQEKCQLLPAKMKKMYNIMVSKIHDAENEIEDMLNKNDSLLEMVDLKCKKVKGFLTSVMNHLKDYLAKYGLSTPK